MRGKGGRKQRNLNDSGHFADASKPENWPRRGKTKIVITVAYGTEYQKKQFFGSTCNKLVPDYNSLFLDAI